MLSQDDIGSDSDPCADDYLKESMVNFNPFQNDKTLMEIKPTERFNICCASGKYQEYLSSTRRRNKLKLSTPKVLSAPKDEKHGCK